MNRFIFKSYEFDTLARKALFRYAFEDGLSFEETVQFDGVETYDEQLLDKALFLAFIIIGVSYYKTFPSVEIILDLPLDKWQADFFNSVYQEGLSQFAFENSLKREDLAHFVASAESTDITPTSYNGSGILSLQSGGKDSLLVASFLKEKNQAFSAWYLKNGDHYPHLLDRIGSSLVTSLRHIDHEGLKAAFARGAKNGHVPITYIVMSLALIQTILLNKKDVIVSIAHEGEEAHDEIGDLAVTHQWSKTWAAEMALAEYVSRYLTPNIHVGSPLRSYSELHVAELFVEHSWQQYGHEFSSCNIANYRQDSDNTSLKWCGDCPKCANSYLLFAPFVPAPELQAIFSGQDLFAKQSLEQTFKGLLGIDGVTKPFECVGEIEELRLAYHKALARGDYSSLSFEVPGSTFNYLQTYPAQDWAVKMLQ